MRRFRRGYSFIELLAVLAIIGLLARYGIPRFWELRRRATAAAVVGDMKAIRHAALHYYQDDDKWPADYPAGATPSELVRYLPDQFTFNRGAYQLDFERWTVGGNTVVGVGLITSDPSLGPSVESMMGKSALAYSSGTNYTFLLIGMGGSF